MDLKISDLPPQFENIAIEFGETLVYFQTEKMVYKFS